MRFDVASVHPGGDEAAVVATVTIAFAGGRSVAYDGVFVHRVSSDGRIESVRS